HAAMVKPGQLGISAQSVGKYLQAMDVGGVNIQDGSGTKYVKFKFYDAKYNDGAGGTGGTGGTEMGPR
ncbi:MAG: hypothetical protein NTV34_19935, partial [Proteobacteria bacterium]|nr:hypothetical protein [Pseudomonadota bacterium]